MATLLPKPVPGTQAPTRCTKHRQAYLATPHATLPYFAVLRWHLRPQHHQLRGASPPRRLALCSAIPESTNEVSGSYPFHEQDYHKLTFAPAPYGPMKLTRPQPGSGDMFPNGLLVFKREQDSTDDALNILELVTAGDTAFNTYALLSNSTTDRPMVHSLMWTLLERAQASDSQNWTLLRVAIVDMQGTVFIGRMFFGDPRTGEVKFDCDCRPSDGCYLAIQAKCPFFVSRRVWDMACIPIQRSAAYKLVAGVAHDSNMPYPPASSHPDTEGLETVEHSHSQAEEPMNYYTQIRSGIPGGRPPRQEQQQYYKQGQAKPGKPANPDASADNLTVQDVTLLRPDDPPAIQLLKRELEVAVSEENYTEAIRIRDHEWMIAYREIHALRLQGRYEEAAVMHSDLCRHIEDVTSSA